MDSTQKTLVSWLRDAHAMEVAAVDNLEKHVNSFSGYPDVAAKFREDLDHTRVQVKELERGLSKLGADESSMKDAGMKMAGKLQPFLGSVTGDDEIKHLIMAHTYKHFEVASFKSLAAAAASVGETEIRDMCEQSAQKKTELADWIATRIPTMTTEYLARVH